MTSKPPFAVEPWCVREERLELDHLAQTESVFALSNGHIGLRANLDEGEPYALPGTYLNAFYEVRPLPYAEAGYGFPDTGQTVVNVTDGKLLRLLVDDETFDLRYGRLERHERTLDLRAGVLTRTARWCSPAGKAVDVRSVRLVSFSQRSVAAIHYEVEPVDEPVRLVLQSELVANQALPPQSKDPRAAAALASPLAAELRSQHGRRVVLVHRTRASGLRMAAGMDHEIDCPDGGSEPEVEAHEDLGRLTVAADVEPGQTLRVVKYLAYAWSSRRSETSLRDQAEAALAEARHTGWDGLLAEQRATLDSFWEGADVELEGDPELQQAVRFALFHTFQAGARAERRAIPAKGLTGAGYDGHTFWDTESFVLPVLTYTAPDAARDALAWRHSTLDLARSRARDLGREGAAFPWRTIRGHETSGYWPAGTAAFHVNADIADAVGRYVAATGDEEFERDIGTELLVETARLWISLGHHDSRGGFRIDGVTGPDEYSAIADNNVFTNLMAQRNLALAADAASRHTDRAAELGVGEDEVRAWREAADSMLVPYDETLGVHPQAEAYTEHDRWDFESTRPEQYPLLLHFPYYDLYRKQVVKQADLVLALHRRGDAFSPEDKARNFAFYEELTVRDSSLSASTQAIVAAEVGQLDLAYAYFGEAALMDLDDLEHNTADGVHIASLAGAWMAVVCGFGGMRDHGGEITFAPRLPRRLDRIGFRLTWRGSLVEVVVERDEAHYALLGGEPVETEHHGEAITIESGEPLTVAIPPAPSTPHVSQPPGREPRAR